MLAMVDEVLIDAKVKTSVTSAIKDVPLSDTTNIRRVKILATDVFDTLLGELDVMSTAVDESTDKTDIAQLCMYVRFYDGKRFREELLCLLPLKGHTTGEVVFGNISAFFEQNDLDMKRVCMLVTDGAPSMAGKISGLVARWSAIAPKLTSLHCIVHQTVLCAKLSGQLKINMDNVMNTINFIRSTSSLQHCASSCQICLQSATTCFYTMMSGDCQKAGHWSASVICEWKSQLFSTAASTKKRRHT